jgi:F-type H+-transporting ATPase subunit alpha
MKAFEETFLLELENKMPDLLAEFKKGNLPEDGINKMVSLAQGMIPQFSK